MKQSSKVLGIDLGTTNSEVAILIDGKPILLSMEGSPVVPSVISIGKQGEVLIGRAAVNNELANPEGSVRLIKRKMGRDEVVTLHGKDYTPAMLSSLILRRLKQAAEDFLGEPVTQAVITVPAFFNEKQREATKQAGELAGLEVVKLLNEPTSAALAYSLGRKEKELSLVYDLGGGTFDVSIVDLSSEVMEVLASEGDVELGGSDFDLLIAEKIKQQFMQEHDIDLSKNSLSWMRLLRAAETAKIRLSSEADAEISEEFIAEKHGVPLHVQMRITRAEFEDLIRPFLKKTIQCMQRALKQAECLPSSLDRVILVGGSTKIPLVAQLLQEELFIAPQSWINPEIVVAQGACIEAASFDGVGVSTVLVDLTPHSLGLETVNEWDCLSNSIIIHKNTPLPCSASRLFYKRHLAQGQVCIRVTQGESFNLDHVTQIGEFLLEDLENSDRPEIYVKFELDRSGLLQVTVIDVALGKKVSHVIEKKDHFVTKSANLADLKALHIQKASDQPIEAVEEENVLVQEAPKEPLVEALIQKALALLQKEHLSSQNQEELQREIHLAKEGGNVEKLEELLYFLE